MITEVRALPYPVLVEGDLSWPQGRYEASVKIRSDHNSADVVHRLSGAPFLETLIRDRRAEYACSVAVPITNYRRLHLSRDAEQVVNWEADFCGEPPRLRPMILAVQEIRHVFTPEDGVDEIWQGRELTIPKGARLALDAYHGDTSSLENLLEMVLDKDLPEGSFKIVASEDRGFYFKAHAAPNLCHFLQNPIGQSEQRGSILTHMVSRCLEILAKDFGRSQEAEAEGGGWAIHQNLVGLAGLLEHHKQPLWDDPDFAADKVATAIYPHIVAKKEDDGEEE